ncbi:metal-sulfur cluster assembly factor [Candidatus Peregrinibacteria bacterium]|nr:metal-sulfur cluster assembly factor [Candidatus Peregrinibacteria bacterium]
MKKTAKKSVVKKSAEVKVQKAAASSATEKTESKKSSAKKTVKGLPQGDFVDNNFQVASFSPGVFSQMSPQNSSLIFPEPPKTGEESFKVTFDETNPYYHILNQIIDPEVAIGIADMGIIYEAKEKNGVMSIVMTLTSMGCPAGPQITTDIDEVLHKQPGIKDVEIEVVWDPPWSPDRIKPELRMMLFGY